MSKTEENLVKAIDGKDYKASLTAFNAFQKLKDSTDEQCDSYFRQIEAFQDVTNKSVDKKAEEERLAKEAAEAEAKAKEEAEAAEKKAEEDRIAAEKAKVIPKDKRGKKAKEITRDQVNSKWNEFLGLLIDFKAQEKQSRGKYSRWATTTLNQLRLVNKRRFR